MSPQRSPVTSFTDLIVWQRGHSIVLAVYKNTSSFPKEEMFGLTNQLRRCAISITSNIAEGFSRRTKKDKAHLFTMALGSTTELQNQLLMRRETLDICQERISYP